MKYKMQKAYSFLIALILCTLFAASAFAGSGDPASSSSKVIVEFEALGALETIKTDYKLALVTLKKRFPSELSVLVRDDSASGERKECIPVDWACVEDYDQTLDAYHFKPVFEGYELSDGVEPPMLTVVALHEPVTPPLIPIGGGGGESAVSGYRLGGNGSGPSAYNSFEAGRLPPVRSQSPYGSCWAFSSIGSLEADLISKGAGTDIDLSELHLAYYYYNSYFDEKGCNVGDAYGSNGSNYLNAGGDQGQAARVLSCMIGPASESSVPYSWGIDYQPGPTEGRAYKDAQLLNSYEISSGDIAGIKDAIQQHGGVAASIYWDDEYYSYNYNSLYYPRNTLSNHAIMLVGWDDSFPSTSFNPAQPKGNGAWLVRNSWGFNGYGRDGYFWLSYEDPTFLHWSVRVFEGQLGQYDHCYSYASVPDSIDLFEFSGSVTAEQHFMVDGGEAICAVGFETYSSSLSVQIELSLGDKTVQASAETGSRGYYTVHLPETLVVPQRSDVTLTMLFQGSSIRIPAESLYTYSSATAFCSSGGLVLNGSNTGEDGLIKLFTMDCDVTGDGVRISSETFPDNVFRNYISSRFDLDHDGFLSGAELAAVTVIDVIPSHYGQAGGSGNPAQGGDSAESGQEKGNGSPGQDEIIGNSVQEEDSVIVADVFLSPGPVRSLVGLEWFTELEVLLCADNQLTAIDLSGNTKLQQLDCCNNLLASLDLSKNTALKMLSCDSNPLTELDISKCPDLVWLVANTLPGLSKYTIVFSAEGLSLSFDIGVSLTPAFHLGTGLSIEETFPDLLFRSYVAAYCDMDQDGTLTDHEFTAVKYIECSGSENNSGMIESLAGAELFTALEELYCSNNQLTVLDVSHYPALKALHCRNNALTQLDMHFNLELEELDCSGNAGLSVLNLSGCSQLLTLSCSEAILTGLDLSDCLLLEELSCSNNLGLASLSIGSCAALRTLSCHHTQVPRLDLSGCAGLQKLECGSNSALTSLNAGSCTGLTVLSCSDCTSLENLNVRGCASLITLECCNGHLSNLDLRGCSNLSNLKCYGNLITELDVVPSSVLSAILEYFSPVIENGIASYPYEGHKISFDEGVALFYAPDFILPDSLNMIEQEAFRGCTFRYVELSGDIQSIGQYAFADCPNLIYITIWNEDAEIAFHAFGEEPELTIRSIPGGRVEAFASENGIPFASIF